MRLIVNNNDHELGFDLEKLIIILKASEYEHCLSAIVCCAIRINIL